MNPRDDVLRIFREALPGKPVLWATEATLGCSEELDATLEIVDIPSSEDRMLIRALRPQREQAYRLLGHDIVLVFHTPENTTRYHATFGQERAANRPRPGPRVRPLPNLTEGA